MKLHPTTVDDGRNFKNLRPLMKQDSESYETEVELLYRDFKYTIDAFSFNRHTHQITDFAAKKEFGDNAFFLSQLCPFYPHLLSDFPHHLLHLLHSPASLPPSLRLKLTQSLVLLLNKNVVAIDQEFRITNTNTTTTLLELLMRLQTVNDRSLRKLSYSHVILSVKKHRNDHVTNKRLQSIVVNMLQSGEEALAKRSLVVVCTLRRMNVWCNELVSNAICRACYSQHPSIRKAALLFLLSYHVIEDDDDDGNTDVSSNEDDESCNRQSRVVLNREQVYKAFVDELYSYLHRDNRRVQLSEVIMMTIIVIALTIGIHLLIKPKFYCFLGKYLMPHEKITKLLAAAVEVFHDDVPDDDIKPLFLQIVNTFIHNRSQSEALAVGLNVVREICLRMPRLMNDDLLQDLVSYNREPVKAVSTAAHSLLKLFKERPRSTTNVRLKQYGEMNVATSVPGADLLWQGKINVDEDYDSIEVEKDDDAEDVDGGEDVEDDIGDDSDEAAEDDVGGGDDDVIGLENSAVNECCAGVESEVENEDRVIVGEEIREDDVGMEDELSSLIESDDSHVEIFGERKRKYADFDQLDSAESDLELWTVLSQKSKTDDHFYSNEEFQQIKKLLATQRELQRCLGSKSATSSDPSNLKPVNPAKLEANIRTKMTKEQRRERMLAGREDRNEYKSRAAVKQNKKGGSSNRQKDHKKFMPIAVKRGKIARSKQEKRRKRMSGKQFRGKKAWK